MSLAPSTSTAANKIISIAADHYRAATPYTITDKSDLAAITNLITLYGDTSTKALLPLTIGETIMVSPYLAIQFLFSQLAPGS